MSYVDLHSHILFGLDDGSPDLASSLMMLRGLASLGFETVCATPHQKAGQFLPSADEIASTHEALVTAADAEGIALTMPLAAENMWDQVFFERLTAGEIPSYDDGPAFLVEFQLAVLPTGLMERLFELRMKERLPVIAHPERYQPLWKDADRLDKLRNEAALVVDLGAVAGYHGRKEMKAARRMVTSGIAHAAASDAHSPSDVRVAAEGIAWIRKKAGADAVTRLLDTNPRKILAGEHPDS